MPAPDVDPRRLLALLDRFRGRTVVVFGDLIADEFIYGQVARVSREAPVLILKYDSTEIVPGGAGNAARNVASLGGAARAVGLVGRDDAGRRLLRAMGRGVSRDGLLQPADYRTPTKTRILAGGVHSAKQQVVRVDRDGGPVAARARGSGLLAMDRLRRQVAVRAAAAVRGCDALLVSDYGTGLVTPALVAKLRRVLAARPGPRVPVLVDSRYGLLRFTGMTACTPNESEVEHLLGVRIGEDPDTIERAGRTLLDGTRARAVLVTRGSRGMALFEPRQPTRHIDIYGTDEIADVTGAGDTVIATLTLALASGASFYEAARLANYAGGIVVMKRGTATVSAAELRDAVASDLRG